MSRLAALLALCAGCFTSTELEDSGDAGFVDMRRPDTARPAPGTLVAAFSGRTDRTDEAWFRPFRCEPETSTGELHPYVVETFENTTSFDLSVDILVDWSFDGFLHVYRSFDPATPSESCIDSNDDFMSTSQSLVEGISVPRGTSIDLVLSSFRAFDSGQYDVFITVR
ncbi:MAG: hypothetical protein AAF411_11455 [Myxococcota bacterium]